MPPRSTPLPPPGARPGTGRSRPAAGARPGGLRSVPVESPSITFAHAVRAAGQVARGRGLQVPVFRSPPTLPGVDRTLRRTSTGGAVVAVRLLDRPAASIQADVVDGIVAANSLSGLDADGFRRAAWAALGSTTTRRSGHGRAAPDRAAPVRSAPDRAAPVRSDPEVTPGSSSDARVA